MNKKLLLLLVLVLTLVCTLGTKSAHAQPKNVIFFIGDGMGPEQVKAGNYYLGGSLSFELFPYQGELTTYSANASVTDSAAAATALATGVKVNNDVISVALPGNGSELETLLEYSQTLYKSTGLVTTTYMTHATPAAFGAHEPARGNYTQIANDYLTQTRPNVLFGGSSYMSGADGADYTEVFTFNEMDALDTENYVPGSSTFFFSGQFGVGYMPYEYDGLGNLPHLSEMTATALAILDNDLDGFFLMVEGGRIDHASHINDPDRIEVVIPEVIEFANAVQVAIDWAAGRSDTLILVSADHETGGLTVTANNGAGFLPDVTWSTTGHTAINIPVYAWGVNADLIGGIMDNTDMFGVATTDPPDISFAWPTPDDGATITESQVQINTVITEADLAEVTFQWDGTDYTPYDSSLVLMYNFNNVDALGEFYNFPLTGTLYVRDLSLNGKDAVEGLNDMPSFGASSGLFGGSYYFDGVNDSIIVADADGSLAPGAGDFAVALWLQTTGNTDADILNKTSGTGYKLEHSSGGANKISLSFLTDGTIATISSVNSYADGFWHFVVAQRVGNQAELWIDGVLDGTAAVTGAIDTTANLIIGSDETQTSGYFQGDLDEVRIYQRSFNAGEIQFLYDSNLSKYLGYVGGPTEWTLEVYRAGLMEGDYTYGVSAMNAAFETGSDQRTVWVDLPNPPDVTLVSPADGSQLNTTTVTFTVDAVDPIVALQSADLYVGTAGQTLTFSGPAQTEDAQIDATYPNENFGSAVSINVDGENPHSHAVIKFPNLIGTGPGQVPPGTIIESATLQVNCTNLGALMQVYRLTTDWSEDTVTWNDASPGTPWTTPGGDYDSAVVVNGDCTATGLRTIDITTFVQDWSDGTGNYGILLTDTGTDGVDFDSSESGNPPLLTVIYAGDWQKVGVTQNLSGASDTATFTDISLNDETDYIWNCLVTNIDNVSSWAVSNFTLSIDGQTPDAPVLVGPADGATGAPIPTTLEVTVTDPQPSDLLEVSFYGRPAVSAADDFTIIVLPDTQFYSQSYPAIFTAQTQWIVDSAAADNIVFVTHEGDLVQNYDNVEQEWINANTSMFLLDGQVPYGVLPGNHDLPTNFYNQYFSYTRYEGMGWYGGHYPSTGNDNSYQLITAGGMDLLMLHLQYNPGSTIADPIIAWADGILKSYPERMAIITTHAFMDTNTSRIGEGAGIWNVLVQGNDNVYFVLCGHKSGEAARTDLVNGRDVHQLLADYQSRANGGDGWLRIMRFAPSEDKVYVDTYSPYLDSYETDADSQFTLDVPLNGFELLGTNIDVASGSNTSFSWTGLAENSDYEWYVTVTDPTAKTSTGTVWSFTSGLGNQSPTANDDSATTNEDIAIAIDVLTNDTDPESVPLTVDSVTQGTNGTVVNNGGVNVTYTPNANFSGIDTFTYMATDGTSNSNSATVTVTVNNIDNDAPVANDDSVSTNEDVAAAITLTATDPDDLPAALTYEIVAGPTNGSLSGDIPDLTYTPAPEYSGPDSFTFKVTDDEGAVSNIATISIDVILVNDPPVAVDDPDYSIDEDNTLTVTAPGVLANDYDIDSGSITVVLNTDVTDGVLNLSSDGSFTYDPDPDFSGEDSFTYQADDTTSLSNVATVTITVNPVNDPPTAIDDSASTLRDVPVDIDVLSNDDDTEGDALSVGSITQQPTNGSVVNNGANVTYTPNPGYVGDDSFTYTANDGTENGNAATVTVTVNAPGPTTLFTDGFESGNIATGGWTSSGSVVVKEPAAYEGVYGVQIGGTASIVKSVSTVGFADIHVKYAWKTKGLRSGESLTVEWFDGTNWNEIESTSDTAWAQRDKALGAGAGENTAFSVRFRTNASRTNRYGSVDSVEIIGTTAGPDLSAPIPNPMTWATAPYSTGETSIAMVATTASDSSGVEYSFTCTAGGGHDSGWQDSTSYVDTGLSSGTLYTYTVTARDKSIAQNSTAPSTAESATTDSPDLAPPSPTPMTWATVPYSTGETSIAMVATTASDASGVEYSFVCTAGPGNNSGWQDSPSYEDTGLTADTQYTYTVTARDKSVAQNSTGSSTAASAMTDAETGDVVTITKAEFNVGKSELKVEATSSDGGTAVTLTVVGYGDMTYDSRKNKYVFREKPMTDPGGTVTVTSSSGGSDTMSVTYK